MGEVAEDILDGTRCEGCGVYLPDIFDGADPPGHPRRCAACQPRQRPDKPTRSQRRRRLRQAAAARALAP